MAEGHPVRRLLIFLAATALCSLGVDVAVTASLGTSPISSVPYVLSLIAPLSFGTFTFIINMVFVVGCIIVMGRDFRVSYLWMIPILGYFSILNDAFLYVLDWLQPSSYIGQWVLVVIASFILAFGISLQLATNLGMMPGDYFINFVSVRTGAEFGRVKVIFDVSMIAIAAALSLLFMGGLYGVREGTVYAAVFTGIIIRWMSGIMRSHGIYEWAGHRDIPIRPRD